MIARYYGVVKLSPEAGPMLVQAASLGSTEVVRTHGSGPLAFDTIESAEQLLEMMQRNNPQSKYALVLLAWET